MATSTPSADPSSPRPRRAADSTPKPRRVQPMPPATRNNRRAVGVRPAYLALGSFTSVVRARRVLQDASWTRTHQGHSQVFERGNVRVLLNDSGDHTYQREALTAHGPGWSATFSAQTPDEVLAAAAEALVETAACLQEGLAERDDLDAALHCLSEAGWDGADTRGGDITRITSPDHLAEILHPAGRQAWLVTAGIDGEGWEAELVGDCPQLLIENVVGCLAAESPVRRSTADLPSVLRRYLDIGPDPYRSDAARRTSPAARAAGPTALVITPAQSATTPARRAR